MAKGKLLVSVVSGHVLIEDEAGAEVFDIPCKSTVDATMLKTSIVGHSVEIKDKGLYIRQSKKEGETK
jgi:hypothetical protein